MADSRAPSVIGGPVVIGIPQRDQRARLVTRLGRAFRRRRNLRTGLTQLVYVVLAMGLAIAVSEIQFGPTVASGGATQFLVTVGAGVVTFIGVVYSLLFLVVQFGTATFTPRLNLFRDSPIVWHAFGYFIAVFVYCFTLAFAIGNDDDVSILVPISVVVLLVVALGMFRTLQTRAFESIQLARTLDEVEREGRHVIEGLYQPADDSSSDDVDPQASLTIAVADNRKANAVRWPHGLTVLQTVDVPRLVRRAQENGAAIELLCYPGQTLFPSTVVAVIHGSAPNLEDEITHAFVTGPERTFEQDAGFAFRVLADIAIRALSVAVNDPTTAVQTIDRIDSLLRLLVSRDLDVRRVADEEGELRLVLTPPTWDDYLSLAVDEIIDYSSGSSQVVRRLRLMLEGLLKQAPQARRAAITARLERIAGQQPSGLRQAG
jgi:uncharacterized membrane protein